MTINEKWMRRGKQGDAHAIDEQHLAQAIEQEWETAYPIAVTCGPLPTKELVEDNKAPRCRACQRAVDQRKQRQS